MGFRDKALGFRVKGLWAKDFGLGFHKGSRRALIGVYRVEFSGWTGKAKTLTRRQVCSH